LWVWYDRAVTADIFTGADSVLTHFAFAGLSDVETTTPDPTNSIDAVPVNVTPSSLTWVTTGQRPVA
jgi:hypothetical protein